MSAVPRISEREVDSWIYEPIRWARKFGGDRFDPWSGQEEFWIEYGKLLNAKILRWKGLPMTEEQKQAVLARDLNRCIAAGGNIYFLAKIGATDGKSFQQMAGSMTGMTEEEYREMMIKGGRSAEGNRVVGEDGDAQAHRQPQGAAGRKD